MGSRTSRRNVNVGAQVLRRCAAICFSLFVIACGGSSSPAPSQPSEDAPPTSPVDQTFDLVEDTTLQGTFNRGGEEASEWAASFELKSVPRNGELTLTSDSTGFTYRPALNFAGIDRFFYSTNQFSEVTMLFRVANQNDTPRLQVEIVRVIEQGKPYSATLAVLDPDNADTHRFGAENLPNWMELNPLTGELSGLPTQNDVGVYRDIVFSVEDAAGESDVIGGVSIEVLDVNDAPTLDVSQFPEELLARKTVRVSVFPDDPDGEGVVISVEPNEFIESSVSGTTVELTASDVAEVLEVNLVVIATDARGQEGRAVVPFTLRPRSITGRGITLHGRGSGIGAHLVVIGDGYRSDQLALFREHVESFINAMRNDPGIDMHFDAWNIHMLHVPSADSGIDDNLEFDIRDTAFDTGYFCLSVQRLICGDQAKMFGEALDDYANLDQLVLLVNDSRYGGSGGSVAIASAYFPEIALHELGHSVADLADEYVDTLIPDVSSIEFQEGRYANVSQLSDPARVPWSHWISDTSNYPTLEGQSGVGVFEGGFYQPSNYFRPTSDSRMRTFNSDFGPVNSEQWAISVYQLTNPVHEFSPIERRITLAEGQVQTFSVEPLFGPDIQEVSWLLNDVVVARGDEARLIRLSPAAGRHTLQLVVRDISGLIRHEPPANGQFEWSWEITVR